MGLFSRKTKQQDKAPDKTSSKAPKEVLQNVSEGKKKSEAPKGKETPKTAATKQAPKSGKSEKKEKGPKLFVREKQVLIRPLITEKVTALSEKHQYVFEVHPAVNKIEIKNEIKKAYNVEPVKVNIVTMKGKNVRFGRTLGKKKDWKKAIVILKKGDTIEATKA